RPLEFVRGEHWQASEAIVSRERERLLALVSRPSGGERRSASRDPGFCARSGNRDPGSRHSASKTRVNALEARPGHENGARNPCRAVEPCGPCCNQPSRPYIMTDQSVSSD